LQLERSRNLFASRTIKHLPLSRLDSCQLTFRAQQISDIICCNSMLCWTSAKGTVVDLPRQHCIECESRKI
jgi:hypothetical protein